MISRFSKINKRKIQRKSALPILLTIFTLLIVGFLIFSNWRINQQRTEQISRIKSLRQEIQNLEEKNRELESLIAQIPTEFFLEQKARELGLKRPGEEVVVISLLEEIENKEGDDKKTFWQKLLNWLGF
ncbi:MAG: septum formation initiator family protein [Candidatus Nealsonbacteria bacterium]|nr:septum formation initiator family protein [Candidatus Nealsonbacteria bacterium]